MTKNFECKLKGRLGLGPNDCKGMRVLSRIVRVTDRGLPYEADPRHAEMLIRSLDLGDSKAVVTPGVKLPIDEDVDPEAMDADASVGISRIIARPHPLMMRERRVHFCSDVDTFHIPAYPQMYGRHPREFVFSKHGKLFIQVMTLVPIDLMFLCP